MTSLTWQELVRVMVVGSPSGHFVPLGESHFTQMMEFCKPLVMRQSGNTPT